MKIKVAIIVAVNKLTFQASSVSYSIFTVKVTLAYIFFSLH